MKIIHLILKCNALEFKDLQIIFLIDKKNDW